MRWLKLWTVRPASDFLILQKYGVYRTDARFIPKYRHKPYQWIAKQLQKKTTAPAGVLYPVWAWHRAYGLDKPKPDLRKKGHLASGEHGVRIEFVVPEDLVLLSSFDGWHAVLNDHCLALNDAEYEHYERLEKSCPANLFENIKTESWLKIFDLNLLPNPDTYEVQAVLWEIQMNWVTKVDFFTAR